MAWQGVSDPDWDRDEGDPAGRPADPCEALAEEILQEQIAMHEKGLPRAPGMERAALANEINGFRERLDARRQALSQ
jgi:hypothetical protein